MNLPLGALDHSGSRLSHAGKRVLETCTNIAATNPLRYRSLIESHPVSVAEATTFSCLQITLLSMNSRCGNETRTQ